MQLPGGSVPKLKSTEKDPKLVIHHANMEGTALEAVLEVSRTRRRRGHRGNFENFFRKQHHLYCLEDPLLLFTTSNERRYCFLGESQGGNTGSRQEQGTFLFYKTCAIRHLSPTAS